ncbi:MAG TPA: (d)CMP kinase [Chitinophagales bacterium]|nr:(d)CMP kinase [Chitinophagales bacterium]HRG85081.1 (d)CMP kinase [Chitinophagales bacterium]HRH52767.1 (d)CMP kinase [Chitinophagales bacterium]
MKKILIAIDGYAACGKSTLAKQLASHLHYLFLDTGAMYRAVTLYLLDNHINWLNNKLLNDVLDNISITFQRNENGKIHCLLNGDDVEEEIRSMRVSNKVSEVAAVSAVRKFLVQQQQIIGKEKGIVMDGRDIGTVVFPHAELKLFVTADMETRVQRRLLELQSNNIQVSEDDIRNNLIKRDHEETTRADSPLIKAADAIVIDNTNLTPEEQFKIALNLAEKIIGV